MTEEAKQNSRWRKQFMDLKREKARKFREGKAEGLLEGAQQKAIEDAKSFYANGASIELIAKSLGMSEEKVL